MEVRLLLILVMIFLVRVPLHAQNLVPNPSFECGSYHCGPNTYSPYFSAYACNWSCPNRGTSDILSTVIENKECWASSFGFVRWHFERLLT